MSLGLDGCEVRLCDPCARVRPCVPCLSRVCPGSPRCLFREGVPRAVVALSHFACASYSGATRPSRMRTCSPVRCAVAKPLLACAGLAAARSAARHGLASRRARLANSLQCERCWPFGARAPRSNRSGAIKLPLKAAAASPRLLEGGRRNEGARGRCVRDGRRSGQSPR